MGEVDDVKKAREEAYEAERRWVTNKTVVILFSGGLDSTTCLYWALSLGCHVHLLSMNYGQRHIKELRHARNISLCCPSKMEHQFLVLPPPFGPSALSASLGETMLDVPKDQSRTLSYEKAATYVPYRNMIMLSYAASYAVAVNSLVIMGGWNQQDYSGYPDCREDFLTSMKKTIYLAGYRAIKIIAPLLHKSKTDIIEMGVKLNVPYEQTWSCYEGGDTPCLHCDACLIRQKAFTDLGRLDHHCMEFKS